MTDPPHSTMAPPEAAAPPTINQTPSNAPPNTPARPVTKSLVTRDFDLTIRAFFPAPTAPTKFSPTSAMHQLLRTMLKDEPSLVLRTANNDHQLVLASESLPTGEKAFKQFFNVSNPRTERQNPMLVCIGCHVLSNRRLGHIKFHSPENHLLSWLKKAKVFIEADSLGTERPITVGYFTKIDPTITHLANFREHLVNQLMLIDIDAETAIELAPHLKATQLEAMSNGDEFTAILPPFEIYKTRLSHGRDATQITTEVLGVKSAPRDAKLLGEFFARMASEISTDSRDGVFIPKGAAFLLGTATYAQILQDNVIFLNNVTTIPVNMAYEAWHAVIDPINHKENEPFSIYDHLVRQPWFLRIESVTRNKCFLVTTKTNLPVARAWIDDHLEPMIRKSIPPGTDPPPSCLPRRLDKPTFTKTSHSYADILKRQFSLAPNSTTTPVANTRPPRKRQATTFDYDSDQSTEYPPLAAATPVTKPTKTTSDATTTTAQPATMSPEYVTLLTDLKNEINQLKVSMQPPSTTTITTVDYAAEMESLKRELQSLRTFITAAVDQLKTEIVSIHASPPSNEMEIVAEQTTEEQTPTILALIAELKHDIATVVTDMQTLFRQQQQPRNPFEGFKLTPMPT